MGYSKGPYLDFSKFSPQSRGYTDIAMTIIRGNEGELDALLSSASGEQRTRLANLVMTGGARPLHMCGMSRGGDASGMIATLIGFGADVNSKDNYEMTPMDRLSSNAVTGNQLLQKHGAVPGRKLPRGAPRWEDAEFAYSGPGEV